MRKKVELRKGTAKEMVLKGDRALFTQMIIIAEARQLSMKKVLSHPLSPLPWSMAASDGSLKKTAKSALAKELQKDAPAENLPPQSACGNGPKDHLEKLQIYCCPWSYVKALAAQGSMLCLMTTERYR